jgi:hypothetical protein
MADDTDAACRVLPFQVRPLKCRVNFGPQSTTMLRKWATPGGCGGGLCPPGFCNIDADGDCLVTVHEIIPAGELSALLSTADRAVCPAGPGIGVQGHGA